MSKSHRHHRPRQRSKLIPLWAVVATSVLVVLGFAVQFTRSKDASEELPLDAQSSVIESLYHGKRTSQWLVLLEDAEAKRRAKAALALGAIGAERAEIVPALQQVLDDPVIDVRISAATSLGKIGPEAEPAVPALIKALGASDIALRSAVAEALGNVGPAALSAVPQLSQMTQSPEAEWRQKAATALGGIGPEAHAALRPLSGLLEDPDLGTRIAAVTALGQIGPGEDEMGPIVVKILQHPSNWRDRNESLMEMALSRLGIAAVPALCTAAEHEDPRVRESVARSLGRIFAPPAKSSRTNPLLDTTSSTVDVVSLTLLPPQVIDSLAARLSDDDRGVRLAAVDALGRIGPNASDAVEALCATGMEHHDDGDFKRKVVRVLGAFGSEAETAIPTIFDLLYEDINNGPVYGEALRKIGTAAIPKLREAANDRDGAVRSWATETLNRIEKDSLARPQFEQEDGDDNS